MKSRNWKVRMSVGAVCVMIPAGMNNLVCFSEQFEHRQYSSAFKLAWVWFQSSYLFHTSHCKETNILVSTGIIQIYIRSFRCQFRLMFIEFHFITKQMTLWGFQNWLCFHISNGFRNWIGKFHNSSLGTLQVVWLCNAGMSNFSIRRGAHQLWVNNEGLHYSFTCLKTCNFICL